VANTVGEKGQLVIEKPIREALGIRPGSLAAQVLRDDHVEIRFYPPEHNRSLKGILADKITKTPGDRDWRDIQEEAWGTATEKEEAVKEEVAVHRL
jgi:AbrB family looped-hinge helix DNA binding protein